MAPARMVQFIKQHVSSCSLCQEDPDIKQEIEKITEIILPESKIPKAVRLKQEMDNADEYDDDDEVDTDDDDSDDDEDDEEEEEEEVDDDDFGDDEEEPLTPED